jgi:hypothetical protein
MKRRRSNPDNGHRVSVHQQRSAYDIRSAAEFVFPEVVREDNHRTRPRRLVIIDSRRVAEGTAYSSFISERLSSVYSPPGKKLESSFAG